MLPDRLDQIDAALIRLICGEHWEESQILDFKQVLPGRTEEARIEFAKDVCAFANADGGHIIYGVAEENACATSPLLPITGETRDAATRRLLQIAESKIEPAITGLQPHAVPIAEDSYVLILRIPASFDGPHRHFTGGESSRFVIRAHTRTSDMTYSQLRDAFDRTATLVERSREFRSRRIAAIKSGDTWRPLETGPKCIVHLMPLASMRGRTVVDIRALNEGAFQQFAPAEWRSSATHTLNLDGIVVHPHMAEDSVFDYVQVFRSGAIESCIYAGKLGNDDPDIPGITLAHRVRDAAITLVNGVAGFRIAGPAILGISVVEAAGSRLELFDYRRGATDSGEIVDRNDLILPEEWVERIESVADIDVLVRPQLDILYQSFGFERCFEYDEENNWTGGNRQRS